MSLGQSEGTTSTIQQSDPWSGVQQPLLQGYAEAKRQFAGPQPQFFPQSTAVPFANETEQALQAQKARAMAGSPNLQAAQAQNLRTVQGDYLGPDNNPYLSALFDTAADKVQSRVDSPFIGAGRYGSGAHAGTVADALGGLAANIYAPAYENERNRQVQAALAAPGLAAADYADIGQLGAVGARREDLGTRQLQDATSRFYFNQAAPERALDRYMALLQGQRGGTTTTQQPVFGSPAAGALGGAFTGAGLGQMLGMGGWPFALGGAGLGLLSGMV
tara:strand:+ start:16670 stop:17494 length:825 start_codon:yes stop_codon:yes gene_type:complete